MPGSQFMEATRGRVSHIGPPVSGYHPWGGKKPSDQSRRRNLHSLTVTDRILPPHGDRVAFARSTGGERWEIGIFDIVTGTERVLADDARGGLPPFLRRNEAGTHLLVVWPGPEGI